MGDGTEFDFGGTDEQAEPAAAAKQTDTLKDNLKHRPQDTPTMIGIDEDDLPF